MTFTVDQIEGIEHVDKHTRPFPNRENPFIWFLCALREGPKSSFRLYPPGSERYATRSLEAHLSAIDIVFGFLILMPMWDTLEQSIYAPLLNFIPNEEFWGGLLVVRGLVHLIALRINGSAWWTPFLRFGASFVSATFFAALACILTWANPFVPGLVFTVAIMNVVAHWYCVRRSGRDAAVAIRARRLSLR